MDRLSKFDVKYLPSHKLVKIDIAGAVLEPVEGGPGIVVTADYVVLALGVKPVRELADTLRQSGCKKVFTVGDAAQPGRIESAVRSAFETAYNLK